MSTNKRQRGRKLQELRRRWFRMYPLCVHCEVKDKITLAQELDHRIPLDFGGLDEEDNLQGLCIECHKVKSAGEASGDAVTLPEWLEPASCQLHIVFGAPGSGKSKHIDQHRAPDDDVIDMDRITVRLTGKPIYQGRTPEVLRRALRTRNAELSALSKADPSRSVWFAVSAPGAHHRAWWVNKLRPTSHVFLDETAATCMARILGDQRRSGFTANHIQSLNTWMAAERANRPIVIKPPKARIGVDGWPV